LSKRANCSEPIWLEVVAPAASAETVPSLPMLSLIVFAGTVIFGRIGSPSEVTTAPVLFFLNAPLRE